MALTSYENWHMKKQPVKAAVHPKYCQRHKPVKAIVHPKKVVHRFDFPAEPEKRSFDTF